MAEEAKASERKPYRVQVVRGEPYQVGNRTLIPEAKVASYGRARATIGTHHTGGFAAAFVQVEPLAVVEQIDGGENRIPIVDSTGKTLRLMLGAAVALGVLFSSIRLLVARWRRLRIEG